LNGLGAVSQFHRQKTRNIFSGLRISGQKDGKSAGQRAGGVAIGLCGFFRPTRDFARPTSIYNCAPTEGIILQTPALGLTAFDAESDLKGGNPCFVPG
jgi:hypothetical protein